MMPSASHKQFNLTETEITAEVRKIRVALSAGYPVCLSSNFAQRCSFPDFMRLLERLPFPVTLAPQHSTQPLRFICPDSNDDDKEKGLYAQCFGHFELFHDGTPVTFSRKQTKELVALLIDRKGANMAFEELAGFLWEDCNDMPAMKHRLRNLVGDMNNTFKSLGYYDIVVRSRNNVGLKTNLITSDYERYLSGKASPSETFRGEYMAQYSWAETTVGYLQFRTSGL